MLKKGCGQTEIAQEIGFNRTSVWREISSSRVKQTTGKGKYVYRYFADVAQRIADANKLKTGRKPKLAQCSEFLDYADELMKNETFSPDAVVGAALENGLFTREQMVCTKTLYNYIDACVLNTKNIDLHSKLSRKPRKAFNRAHKRVLGTSIDERPSVVNDRLEFGHWEIDCVILKKTKEKVLLTLVERVSRQSIIMLMPGRTTADVNEAMDLIKANYGSYFGKVFKSITADNGSEFADLSDHLKDDLQVYFAHPYSSWERGTNERNNGLIRRFIPKGFDPSKVTKSLVKRVEAWLNNYPRKILKYKTSTAVFIQQALPLVA
jgi:IS30 family transposase